MAAPHAAETEAASRRFGNVRFRSSSPSPQRARRTPCGRGRVRPFRPGPRPLGRRGGAASALPSGPVLGSPAWRGAGACPPTAGVRPPVRLGARAAKPDTLRCHLQEARRRGRPLTTRGRARTRHPRPPGDRPAFTLGHGSLAGPGPPRGNHVTGLANQRGHHVTGLANQHAPSLCPAHSPGPAAAWRVRGPGRGPHTPAGPDAAAAQGAGERIASAESEVLDSRRPGKALSLFPGDLES